jgi:hypothetical protein
MQSFTTILGKRGPKIKLMPGAAQKIFDEVKQHPPRRCAVAFFDQLGAETICNGEPVIMEHVLKQARLAFCRGHDTRAVFSPPARGGGLHRLLSRGSGDAHGERFTLGHSAADKTDSGIHGGLSSQWSAQGLGGFAVMV